MDRNRLSGTWGEESRDWPYLEIDGAGALIDVECAQVHLCAGTPEEVEEFFCGGCLKEQAGRRNKGSGSTIRKLFRMVLQEAAGLGFSHIGLEPGHEDLVDPYRRIALRLGGYEDMDCEGNPLFMVPVPVPAAQVLAVQA